MVEAIIREHLYRPITGDVVLIGRQTVYMQPSEVLHLLKEHGYNVSGVDPAAIEVDTDTVNRNSRKDVDLISDRGLFRLIGVPHIKALDHSDYEGADIIHNLADPVPPALRGIADFIVDGSTLDNTFSPAQTITNYAELLRPGGRLLAINAYNTLETSYAIMPPLWHADYFVMNRFADVKVYILVYHEGIANVYYVNAAEFLEDGKTVGRFGAPLNMAVMVLAEKGVDSTSHIVPVQQDYRPPEAWEVFRHNLGAMSASRRHHLARSSQKRIPDTGFVGMAGHQLINSEFSVVK